MSKLGYRVVYALCYVVGLLPLWFLYGVVARVICFVLRCVARYRLHVVRENLSSSFPEKTEKELRTIERKFYRILGEYFVDAVDMASITPCRLLRRVSWDADNRAELNKIANGRNWVNLMAHYGSWELLAAYGLYPRMAMTSIYRPLHSRVFDLYYHRIRNRLPGLGSVPMNDVLRFYIAHKDGLPKVSEPVGSGSVVGEGAELFPFGLALVSDQNAPLDAKSEWVRFLNHPTVFFHGGEKIARKFSLPVFYMHVERVGLGRWRQSFELVWDGVSPTADGDITRAYIALLERDIRRVPELWLWSHRRWKRKPPATAAGATD